MTNIIDPKNRSSKKAEITSSLSAPIEKESIYSFHRTFRVLQPTTSKIEAVKINVDVHICWTESRYFIDCTELFLADRNIIICSGGVCLGNSLNNFGVMGEALEWLSKICAWAGEKMSFLPSL